MTIRVTWAGVFQVIGVVTVSVIAGYVLVGLCWYLSSWRK